MLIAVSFAVLVVVSGSNSHLRNANGMTAQCWLGFLNPTKLLPRPCGDPADGADAVAVVSILERPIHLSG